MSKLAGKLGKQYDKVKDQAKIRTLNIKLGDAAFDLKVRIPLKKEMEEISLRITSPAEEKIEAIYQTLATPILAVVKDSAEGFLEALNSDKETIVIKDKDIEVNGTSVRQVATFTAIWESRVEEYFHLLQSETGEVITESFSEIAAEFPDIAIKEILEAIEGAIKPDYKSAKKN
tara:strand:+ start:1259 stop:1780 length:522 start_codon:yes stop_codon:yes gene_type:complete